MRPGSLPDVSEPELRKETYDGLEIASDPDERLEEPDFVLGLGPATRILAQLTIRRPVDWALDLGTGSGVQALLASRHAQRVVGIDVSRRALAVADLNAQSNGIENVEWREGSWLETVRRERFGLVVAHPPYVISPESDLVYRDSGESTDALVLRLLSQVPAVLEEGGFAQVLCNWVVAEGGEWRKPLEQAIAGCGCDAVLLRYAQQEPTEYAGAWHRRLAEQDPGEFRKAVDRWVAYYREHGVEAIAFGLAVLRRRSGRNWIRAIKVPAAPTDGAGDHVARLFDGWDWARSASDQDVVLAPGPGARVLRRLDLEEGSERITLEVRPNVGFSARIDETVADRLARRQPLPVAEAKRLVGLGLLLTPDQP
jgi:hypothetical protein